MPNLLMKKRVKKIISHPLVSGSTIVFIGMFIANLLGYFFTIGMANFLTSAEFGILAALIAIINILSILASTIMTVFTKFTASYVGKNREDLIETLYMKGTVWIGVLSFIIMLIIIIFAQRIATFLHIDNLVLIYVVAGTLFFAFLTSVGQGILVGLLKFFQNSLINITSSLLKFVLAIVMVYIGMHVFGAIFAIFLANLFGYFILLAIIRGRVKWRKDSTIIPNLERQLVRYGLPVFLSTLGITAFISIDIILIKHFFTEEIAGDYAKLSLMGRSIFYLVIPIASVSFPLFAQKKERKEGLSGILLFSLLLVGIPAFAISIIYFLFPEVVIHIFLPARPVLSLAPLLGLFSVFIVLFSFSYVLNNFYLSIGKTRVFFLTLAGSLFEIFYIIAFHENLYQIIIGLIGISLLLFILLLLYYPLAMKE